MIFDFFFLYNSFILRDSKLGGDVFVGEYEGAQFALKCLKDLTENGIKELQAETFALTQLQHPNIIRFWGIWKDPFLNTSYMVLDYMEEGSLLSYLRTNSLTPKQKLQISLKIALGMQFMEKKKFVHRDLAARNILVDSSLSVKINDFGLSVELPLSGIYQETKRPLPIRWTAPEVIESKVYLSQSDVWSVNQATIKLIESHYLLFCFESSIFKHLLILYFVTTVGRDSVGSIYRKNALSRSGQQ